MIATLALLCSAPAVFGQGPPTEPLQPDEHTLLLYHFDEGQGTVAHDASGHGYDGEVRGAQWAPGRFGSALWFDGQDDSVFRETLEAIRGLKQMTVECWFNQDAAAGRRFLVGLDVGFHFEVDDGANASISIYNQGGGVPNAEGKPHQQIATGIGLLRPRWHHLAATYDGTQVTFFLDGVLARRLDAARDFALGVASRGLWVGCYVGTDFWFGGKIDEVRVSDCVRYDPQKQLQPGERVFDMVQPEQPLPTGRAVCTPQRTGEAALRLTLRKLYGTNAAGWVYLKPPGRPAQIVGQYALTDLADGAESTLEFDVSDEVAGDGSYLVALEQTDTGAYFAVTGAALRHGGETMAEWHGEARSRRTFSPPVLVPLQVGPQAEPAAPPRLMLLPTQADRRSGVLFAATDDPALPATVYGDGYLEWWLDVPREATYQVHLRYAAPGARPCDIVVDGDDLNAYDMCALNTTPGAGALNALWETEGTVALTAGPHWLRLQDVLPEVVALWLEPAAPQEAMVPWERYPVPDAGFLCAPATWEAQPQLGRPQDARLVVEPGPPSALRMGATFANTDLGELFGGDRVRFVRRGQLDLEPFGRLTFGFEGQGSGHMVALWLVDVKGDEKLLWRARDREAGPQQVVVPISFEGNDVFDPGHVTAVCWELDESNAHAAQVGQFAGAVIGPTFERRDVVVPPDGYAEALAAARQSLAAALGALAKPAALESPGFRPWTTPVVPETHPLFAATTPAPVTRATMGYGLHFTGARDVAPGALDDFHRYYDFGDVCWPHIGILPQRRDFQTDADYQAALQALEQRLVDVRDRGLYLFDIWGYVPYGEAGPTPQVTPEHHEILLRILGDRFTGYDNGEQDGRYIGSYADRGPETNRREGWEDFVRWDEAICRDSMNYMNATGSLNFSHYYAERGCRLLGLETAQGLPSDTLMFAFLRGAAKQYGRLTTQATSIWNRFGYNMYQDRRTDGANGYGLGPHKGCSLSLHGRLFLQSCLQGDSIVGSETSQFTADRLPDGAPELSPLGRQHLEVKQWSEAHPDRGVMYTPVAFMLDFYNGWNMPRHLYRGDKYKVWGKLPYEKGDYLVDSVFRMVWPGYEDCSYLRNERGFVTPTPYGDLFDVITNRCHPDILRQYTAVVLLGDVEMTPEAVANLTAFVRAGGDLVVDARQASALPAALTGVAVGEEAHGLVSYDPVTGTTFEEQPYTYRRLTSAGAQTLLSSESGDPLVTVARAGAGRVIVCAADYWMTDRLTYREPDLVNMESPYAILRGVRAVLDRYFASFSPVTIEPAGLNVRVCCYEGDPQHLLVGLTNNDLFADWTGSLKVRTGEVATVSELLDGELLATTPQPRLRIPAGSVSVLDIRLR